MKSSGDKKGERGSAVMEAALVLPIVCLLLLGIMEFGQILMIEQSLTNAAREGARMGALHLNNSTALSTAQSVANQYLTNSGIDLEKTTVTPVFTAVSGTPAVEVQIHYTYASLLTAWVPGTDGTLGLNSRSIMRREA